MVAPELRAVDPFDLPDWLGTEPVSWVAATSVRGSQRITGELCAGPDSLGCDLLAADVAHPQTVLPDPWRHDAHQAWAYGEVLLVAYDGRLTVAVPGTAYSADGVLEAIGRLAKALGARADRFTVCLRL